MQSDAGPMERINSYALVSYIPAPLGSFLDQLRRDLVPGCVAQSHVTVLPPRVLQVSAGEARRELERELAEFPPFHLALTHIDFFPSTSVIYLAIGGGSADLRRMHDRLNADGLAFREPYEYHPHVTLAQDFDVARFPDLLEIAKKRWEQLGGAYSYEVGSLTFVQNTMSNRWQDLAEISLGDPVLAGSSRR